MEKIITPDNIEYQKYLGEFKSLLESKEQHENKIQKQLLKGVITKELQNITYSYSEDGDFIKIDNNNNSSIKIIKPKYLDVFERLKILEENKLLLKKKNYYNERY